LNSDGTITLTITVTNNGPEQAQGVVVKDTLASGTRYTSTVDATANVGSRTVTVNIGTLGTTDTAKSKTFNINFQVTSRATLPVDNTAAVTTTSYDPDLGNNIVNPPVNPL
jgi:trimeric autotransporter adhesin